MKSKTNSTIKNFELFKKIPLAISITIAVIMLLIAIFMSTYSNNQLDANRQKIAYVSDLRQLSEQIDKNSLQARTGSSEAFKELRYAENQISQLLIILKNGGSLNGNTSISSMESNLAPQFNRVVNEWEQNKPLLDALIAQENNIAVLKNNLIKTSNDIQNLLDATANFQKIVQYQDPKNIQFAQELFLLTNRINQGRNDLFSETFSLEKGYALVKDLRMLSKLLVAFKNGSSLYNIQPVTDPNLLTVLIATQRAFEPFSNFSEEIVGQIQTLNSAKEVAFQVAASSKNIVKTAEELDKSYTEQVKKFIDYSYISLIFFVIGMICIGLVAFYSFEQEKKATKYAKELEKNQNNQVAVNLLLDLIKPMDKGDFTHRVYVADRFVTQIAEKVDKTREGFANIVKNIKSSVDSILANTEKTDDTSRKLLGVSNTQYTQLENSIQKLGMITAEMDEVAQTTWIAQEESNESRTASQEGEKLVSQSISKMDEIRENIQESSKKIKKSSESAQAISEVTSLIQNITKKIEILALNAAIQAASSGESGREFAIVAQEVQRLALDSKDATQLIFQLVKEVQEDISVAVKSMENTTQEVIEGAKLTDNAGQALKKIEKLSQQVAIRFSEASSKLEEKSSDMTRMALEMQELQSTTDQSKEIINLTAQQVEALKEISQELTRSIHRYKVDK